MATGGARAGGGGGRDPVAHVLGRGGGAGGDDVVARAQAVLAVCARQIYTRAKIEKFSPNTLKD